MVHPYKNIKPYAHWRKAISEVAPADIDPVVNFKFKISTTDKVATAGSCFAQHIARHLKQSGYCYYVTEPGHPLGSTAICEKFGYGLFSARYGNIYTSRQLVQLFDRAYGTFTPIEDCWKDSSGRFFDPFRPNVQPSGFSSEKELREDRIQHLAAVRNMFENLDVFVFTLGLTETWISAEDNAAFPLCPGVVAGSFDPERYHFLNLTVDEVVADMMEFMQRLLSVNNKARVVLTVSPVPLMATAENQHVLVSTTLSKSILRIAADIIQHRYPEVAYFPSYEIITGSFSRGRYFGPDLRSVTEDGVQHVMNLFLRHATSDGNTTHNIENNININNNFLQESKNIVEVICDEDLLQYK
jgi:hypothetical protein